MSSEMEKTLLSSPVCYENLMNLLTGKYEKTSEEWLQEADRVLAKATHSRDIYPVLDHLRGDWVWIYDVDGRKYLDMTSGVAARPFGLFPQEYRELLTALRQVPFHFASADFDNLPQILLAKKLIEITPGDFEKEVSFTTSGARAVETAVKSILDHSQNTKFIAFEPAFHGRTGFTLPLTSSKGVQRERYPQAFPVIRSPYAYCYRCPFAEEAETCATACVEFLKDKLDYEGKDVAGMVIEPVAGEPGFIPPPKKFIHGVFQVCKELGAYFVSDEVQTGLGRTGKMWGIQHFDVVPDYLCSAKALGGGLPLGACIGPKPLFSKRGRHAETSTAEPFIALLSLFTILQVEKVLPQIPQRGELFLNQLEHLREEYEIIGDARGLGLLLAVEIVKDKRTKKKNPELVKKILSNCVQEGLLVLPVGHSSIRFLPPLDVSEEIIHEAVLRFEFALRKTLLN